MNFRTMSLVIGLTLLGSTYGYGGEWKHIRSFLNEGDENVHTSMYSNRDGAVIKVETNQQTRKFFFKKPIMPNFEEKKTTDLADMGFDLKKFNLEQPKEFLLSEEEEEEYSSDSEKPTEGYYTSPGDLKIPLVVLESGSLTGGWPTAKRPTSGQAWGEEDADSVSRVINGIICYKDDTIKDREGVLYKIFDRENSLVQREDTKEIYFLDDTGAFHPAAPEPVSLKKPSSEDKGKAALSSSDTETEEELLDPEEGEKKIGFWGSWGSLGTSGATGLLSGALFHLVLSEKLYSLGQKLEKSLFGAWELELEAQAGLSEKEPVPALAPPQKNPPQQKNSQRAPVSLKKQKAFSKEITDFNDEDFWGSDEEGDREMSQEQEEVSFLQEDSLEETESQDQGATKEVKALTPLEAAPSKGKVPSWMVRVLAPVTRHSLWVVGDLVVTCIGAELGRRGYAWWFKQ